MGEVKYTDIKVSDFEIGLSLLTGKRIKEVRGYLSASFGDTTFKLTYIEFEDGTMLSCEGEHDFPYLTYYPQWHNEDSNIPNMDSETLNRLHRESESE